MKKIETYLREVEHIAAGVTGEGGESDQPPGIEEGTFDLPPIADAARRVDEFVRWFGDGLVLEPDSGVFLTPGSPPVYARDLAALTQAAKEIPVLVEALRAVTAVGPHLRDEFQTPLQKAQADGWDGAVPAIRRAVEVTLP